MSKFFQAIPAVQEPDEKFEIQAAQGPDVVPSCSLALDLRLRWRASRRSSLCLGGTESQLSCFLVDLGQPRVRHDEPDVGQTSARTRHAFTETQYVLRLQIAMAARPSWIIVDVVQVANGTRNASQLGESPLQMITPLFVAQVAERGRAQIGFRLPEVAQVAPMRPWEDEIVPIRLGAVGDCRY